MPTTGLILEPCTGDTVNQPVHVKVAWSSSSDFYLTCRANTTDEAAAQLRTADSPNTRTSADINPGPSPNPGGWTVYANNTTNPGPPVQLDNQPGVIVQATGTQLPVIIGSGAETVTLRRGAKRFKRLSGDTLPNAMYVVCVVYEIDSSVPSRTIVAVGAALVTHKGGKHKWSVQVKFRIKKPKNFQYIARVTAYDANNASLGTQTKQIKK